MMPFVKPHDSSQSGRNHIESLLIGSELSRQHCLSTMSAMPLSFSPCR